MDFTGSFGVGEPDPLAGRRVRLTGIRSGVPPAVPGGTTVRAVRRVELTDAQIEALLSAVELAEASWWDDPALQRRLAALARARRRLVAARRTAADRPRR